MTASDRTVERLAGALRRHFRQITALLAGALLLLLTGVTLIDVIGRYLFNSPLSGGTEMTELLVMATVFAGLPAICLDDGHVTVDLFTSMMPNWLLGVQLFLTRLFVAGVLGLVSWQMWLHGVRLGNWNQTTIYLTVPLEPVAKIAAAICGASAMISFLMAVLRPPRG